MRTLGLVSGLGCAQVEQLKQADVMSLAVEELGKAFPSLVTDAHHGEGPVSAQGAQGRGGVGAGGRDRIRELGGASLEWGRGLVAWLYA